MHLFVFAIDMLFGQGEQIKLSNGYGVDGRHPLLPLSSKPATATAASRRVPASHRYFVIRPIIPAAGKRHPFPSGVSLPGNHSTIPISFPYNMLQKKQKYSSHASSWNPRRSAAGCMRIGEKITRGLRLSPGSLDGQSQKALA